MIAHLIYQFYLPKDFVEDLKNKCVFITGCDTGFGNALTKKLDLLGCKVFAGCLTKQGKDKLSSECSSRVITMLLDVTDDLSVEKCFDEVNRQLQGSEVLWGVVNNAGISMPFFTVELNTVENFRRTFDVNTLGAVRITKQSLPLIKKSKGRVVNIISAAGKGALPMMAPYAMSKFAMEAFTDCSRVELKRWGVSVHGIEPGFFKTPIATYENAIAHFNKLWADLDEETKAEHEDYRRNAEKCLKQSASSISEDITPVIEAMEHALFSKSAKRRYMVGKDHLFIYSWSSLLPSFIQDKIWTSLLMNFTPKSMATK